MMKVTERKTKQDWTHFMQEIAYRYVTAEKIAIDLDNPHTHEPGSFL